MTYAFVGFGLALLLFVWWRYTSVARGARRRDREIAMLLGELFDRLEAEEPVSADEVTHLADRAHVRPMLYSMLKHFERLDLLPSHYLSAPSQAEAVLAYWLLHPNELAAVPETIEQVEAVRRNLEGVDAAFHVLRFRMPQGHWAAKDDWLLGVAGPFLDGEEPYSGLAGAFSRSGDRLGDVAPTELVDWFLAMATRKNRPTGES